MVKSFIVAFLLTITVLANENDAIVDVCLELHLVPASKAIVQWERVFSSERRKVKYGIEQLSPEVQLLLKSYLIKHAADSSQPMVPGL